MYAIRSYYGYGGAFENLERASKRLTLVVPLALALIFMLVFFAIKSFKQTLMIVITSYSIHYTKLYDFSVTYFVKGNGFLAVYIGGLVIGNSKFVHKRSSLNFFDGLAWMSQLIMFLTRNNFV